MIKNIDVLENMEVLIRNGEQYRIQELSNYRKLRSRLDVKKQQFIWQIADLENLLNERTNKVISTLNSGMKGYDLSTIMMTSVLISSILLSKLLSQDALVEQLEKVSKQVVTVLVPPMLLTVPVFGIKALQEKRQEVLTKEKDELEVLKEIVDNIQKGRKILPMLEALKENPVQIQYNFARSFLNDADLHQNGIKYNRDLLYYLSKVSEEESLENLQALANFLSRNGEKEEEMGSNIFFQSASVQQVIKSYSKENLEDTKEERIYQK